MLHIDRRLLAVVLGVAVGITAKHFTTSEIEELYFKLPGDMLALMVQCITPPVIFLSILSGIAGLCPIPSKNIAVRIEVYFLLTTFVSVTTALILVMSNRSTFIVKFEKGGDERFYSPLAILDLIENVSPMSLLHACARKYKRLEVRIPVPEPNSTVNMNITITESDPSYVEGFDIMGLIAYGVMYGWSLVVSKEKNKILADLSDAVNEMIKEAVQMIYWYMPLGILSVVASYVLVLDSWELILIMGKLVGMVVAGLLIHVTILAVVLLCVGCHPINIIKGVAPALRSALLSSSRVKTKQCCEEKNGVDCRISSQMSNRSMDGTTIYNLFAVVFIAQLKEIPLDLSQLIAIALTVAVTSVAAGWLPLTVRTMCVLTAIELPVKEAATLVVVEAVLDHLITIVNIIGDCAGMAIIQKLSKWELQEMDIEDQRSSVEDEPISNDLNPEEAENDQKETQDNLK